MIELIVSISENNAIGKKNNLPWKLKSDLSHFTQISKGRLLVMGKNNYLSMKAIYDKKYPSQNRFMGLNRTALVLSDTPIENPPQNVQIVNSFDKALIIAQKRNGLIIGGGMIYKLFLQFVDKMYITKVHTTVKDADVFFPEINEAEWEIKKISEQKKDKNNEYGFSILEYTRI